MDSISLRPFFISFANRARLPAKADCRALRSRHHLSNGKETAASTCRCGLRKEFQGNFNRRFASIEFRNPVKAPLHRGIAVFQIVLVAVLGLLSVPHSAHADIIIVIDKGAQSMSVIVDGDRRWVWLVSTGRSGYATPEGSYQALRMEEAHKFREDEAPIPHVIFFTTHGHAIHGTYQVRQLGTPVSHGLVRLSTQNAATLFALVRQHGLANTQVVVTGIEDFRPTAKPKQHRSREPAPQSKMPSYIIE